MGLVLFFYYQPSKRSANVRRNSEAHTPEPLSLPTSILPLGWCDAEKVLASAYVGAGQTIAERIEISARSFGHPGVE